MKKKFILRSIILALLVFLVFPVYSYADKSSSLSPKDKIEELHDEVVEEKEASEPIALEIPKNDSELYERYEDSQFQLITKEAKGITGIFINISGALKEIVFAGIVATGRFNTAMVDFMFSYNLDDSVKKPILDITSGLAGGLLSLAGTLGIASVVLVMALKYIAEQNLKKIAILFFMTISLFVGLLILKDSTKTDSIAETVVNVDNSIETVFITANPTFTQEPTDNVPMPDEGTPTGGLKSASDLISSKVFRTGVYEPYLLFTYGTANEETIRKKTVKYNEKEYDRIGILLDNDFDNENSRKIFEAVTKYESEELKNKTISWKNNMSLFVQGIFYITLNIAQGIVYFLLSMVRLILVLLRWIMFPLTAILLFTAFFNSGVNVYKNVGKGFATVIGLKAIVSFAMVFVASYMSLGYSVSSKADNPFVKIFIILIYLVTPVGLYFFRHLIGKMITGNLSLNDIGSIIRNPYRSARLMNKASREQSKLAKERRKQMKEDRKKKKNGGDNEDDDNNEDKNAPNQPKSSENTRSDKRTDGETDSDSPELDKDGEVRENVQSMRRYRTEKPEKEVTPKSNTPRFSNLRREKANSNTEKNRSKAGEKLNDLHENSRYQDMKEKRDQPERQHVKRQAHQRNAQRQQEQLRVSAVGRSPRRSGQTTSPKQGEFQRNAGNTHKQSNARYEPKKQKTEIQPKAKWRKPSSSHTVSPKTPKASVAPKNTTRMQQSRKQTAPTPKRTGVNRRRV
ncbi:hypothetical protein A5819_003510 [Enterococcus sp. 7E2_DIV0204]|uniref:hypothetical protein n=1 Tax=unclassified Enterococcus TaxID=2608891 RepID=UPI000A349202|nr:MULTISPECIES: hypothetical protein [unclassified Enterococcus]OTN83960.1 hypothetical protein A5819_003510 [Enterococcus sp. 7E2_DIV0204]OTP46868.1 hypothetical protein A5884_003746 [Enterococcus sp. 7D2_DIV0200]